MPELVSDADHCPSCESTTPLTIYQWPGLPFRVIVCKDCGNEFGDVEQLYAVRDTYVLLRALEEGELKSALTAARRVTDNIQNAETNGGNPDGD